MNRWTNSIPLRITVTGTRGKSSVVRLLASILREDGKKVIAKTTGSEAKYLLPNGSESEVLRRGIPSILEQKKLLKKAATLQVDCMISEIMSIHPENHYVESQQLIKPHIVVITNVRLDHTDAMGKTENEIAGIYSLDIPEKAIVFIPAKENQSVFLQAAEKKNAKIVAVDQGDWADQRRLEHPPWPPFKGGKFNESNWADQLPSDFKSSALGFAENLALAASVGVYLGINRATIARGIQNTLLDIGALKIWKYRAKDSGKVCYLVNAFAANDPQSTIEIISFVKNQIPTASKNFIGLLNFRADRGDRTLQWIQALKNGAEQYFKKVFVTGAHLQVVKRKIKSAAIIKDKLPEKIMATIFAEIENQSIIFGFGNIGGNGRLLVDYWNQIGDVYGV